MFDGALNTPLEVYSEPCQTSRMKLFVKKFENFKTS